MATITNAWHVPGTLVRGIVVDGNPNSLGLIAPVGSIAYDTDTPALWQNRGADSPNWIQFKRVARR